ncbi:MAG TPA: hypothetical protein VGD71_10960 [Kribbella sp.]
MPLGGPVVGGDPRDVLGITAAAALTLNRAVPVLVGILGWGLAGLGMGTVFPTLSVLILEYSSREEQGANSSALQLSDSLSTATVLAIGGSLSLRAPDRKLASKHEWIDELTTEISRAQGGLGKPFQHQEALQAAYAARKAINDKLAAAVAPPPAPAPATTDTTDPDVAASLGVLASTHAAPPAGHRPGINPSTARPYSPPAPEHDNTITLD